MKSFLITVFCYLFLSLLLVSCTEEEAAPSCLQVEVIGADCDNRWYVLQIISQEGAETQRSKEYIGQLHGGYVTTDNLPQELRQPGLRLELSLELNGEYSPLCPAITVMYPAVKVKQVCHGVNNS